MLTRAPQWAPKLYHAQSVSHLAEMYRLFPKRIIAGFVFPICNSVVVFLRNVNCKHELGICTGTSCCIVKLLDEGSK